VVDGNFKAATLPKAKTSLGSAESISPAAELLEIAFMHVSPAGHVG